MRVYDSVHVQCYDQTKFYLCFLPTASCTDENPFCL